MSVTPGLDADEVLVPVTGAIYSAPIGTTLPVSASATLASGWVGHGYAFKDDGVSVNETDGVTVKEIRGFQNDALLAQIRRGGKVTVMATLVQVNAANVALYHNDTPDAAGGVKMRPNYPRDRREWVVDIVSGTRIIRHVIGSGEAAPSGERKFLNDTQVGFPIQVTGFEDANGVVGTTYYSELVAQVPTIESVLPSGEGAGEIVTITGTGFLGTTDVDFGASAATDFLVIDSATIVATLPTGSAGSVNVVVTNATGASDAYAYTRA